MTKRKKDRKEHNDKKNEQANTNETNLKKKRMTLKTEPKMKHNVIRVVL